MKDFIPLESFDCNSNILSFVITICSFSSSDNSSNIFESRVFNLPLFDVLLNIKLFSFSISLSFSRKFLKPDFSLTILVRI